MSEEKEATFEEYKTAKKFARWKYKWGLFVLIACWVGIIILVIYVVMYSHELSTHPATYTIEKLGVNDCYCYGDGVRYYINKTAIVYFEGDGGFTFTSP